VRIRWQLTLVAAAALLAGCSTSVSAPRNSPGNQVSSTTASFDIREWGSVAKTPSCGWVSPGQIDADLHLVVRQPVSGNVAGVLTPFVVCNFAAFRPLPRVTISYEPRQTIALFLQAEAGMVIHHGSSISDLGDAAYSFSGPEVLDGQTYTISGVTVLKGSVTFQVVGPATVPELQQLAGQIESKLQKTAPT
jgi:hypothetical protein